MSLTTAPVSTIIVILLAIVGGVDLLLDGNLSHDFTTYAAIIGGSNGLLAIGRGIALTADPRVTPPPR
jgi:hypothetical protein